MSRATTQLEPADECSKNTCKLKWIRKNVLYCEEIYAPPIFLKCLTNSVLSVLVVMNKSKIHYFTVPVLTIICPTITNNVRLLQNPRLCQEHLKQCDSSKLYYSSSRVSNLPVDHTDCRKRQSETLNLVSCRRPLFHKHSVSVFIDNMMPVKKLF